MEFGVSYRMMTTPRSVCIDGFWSLVGWENMRKVIHTQGAVLRSELGQDVYDFSAQSSISGISSTSNQ